MLTQNNDKLIEQKINSILKVIIFWKVLGQCSWLYHFKRDIVNN